VTQAYNKTQIKLQHWVLRIS